MLLILFILISLALCPLFAYAVTTMLSELVSMSSSSDARFPVVAVGPNDPYVIHVAWEDDTDLTASLTTREKVDNAGKDIFYLSKNRTEWLSINFGAGVITGRVQVVSNNSIVSSQNPDISVAYNNITHIVWQAITKPDELPADSSTTFLVHFDTPDSYDANFALGGAASLSSTGASYSNNSLYNGSVYIDSSDDLAYNAENNLNMIKGTVEFWYNPQFMSKSRYEYTLFGAFNSTNTFFRISYFDYFLSYILVKFKYNSSYTFSMEYHPDYEIKKNEWHHIAFTYDLGAGSCKLYFDGFLGAANSSCQGTGFTPANFSIGMDIAYISSSNYRAKGMIDELRISNAVRSADDIRADAGQRDIFHSSLNGTTWSPISVLTSDDGNNSYFPKIDIDLNNTLHVIWNSYYNKSLSQVKYRRKGLTGSWSSAETVSTSRLNYFPDLAVDDNNNSHVVWQEVETAAGNFTEYSHIVYRMRNQSQWSGMENVSNMTYDIYGINTSIIGPLDIFPMPRIAIGARNTTHIAWATQAASPDEGLLFYLSFDNMDANITFANGSLKSNQDGVYSFFSGEKGYALASIYHTGYSAHVNATAYMNYSSSGNFNREYGTITAWVNPSWDPGAVEAGATNAIFTYYSANFSQLNISDYISLYIGQCNGEDFCSSNSYSILRFNIHDNATSQNNLLLYDISALGSNDWYHLAVTWNLSAGNNAGKLYIDGVLMNSSFSPDNNNRIYFNNTPTEIIVGNAYRESTNDYPYCFNGTIDEVMVFDRILGEDEINSIRAEDMDILYRQKNDSGWQKTRFVSSDSHYQSIRPSIAAKDNYAYIAWPLSSGSYEYYTTKYVYGSLYRIFLYSRNDTDSRVTEVVNDEGVKEAYAPDVAAVRAGKIDVVWEDYMDLGGSDIDVFYKELANSTSPSVQMTAPTGGEVIDSNFVLSAAASDIDSAISNVSFYYTSDDGFSGNLICTDTSSPFSCSWSITTVAEDIYRIKAIATSSDGGRNWSASDYIYLDSSPTVSMYTYNSTGNSIGTNAIYKKSWKAADDAIQRPNAANVSSLGTDVTSDAGANVSSPDNERYVVYEDLGCGTYNYTNAIIFKFYINESLVNISNIRVQWQGYGYKSAGYPTNLSIWNFITGMWEKLDYKDFAEEADDDLKYSLTDNFANYLDSENNTLYLLVETYDYYKTACSGGGIFGGVCPAYLSWNGTGYQFETEGILGIFDRRLEMPTYDRLAHARPQDGSVKVAVKEFVDEATYMDSANLLAVDHSPGSEVLLDLKGTPHTIKNPKPLVCADRSGNDCSALVQAEDERPNAALSSLKYGLAGSRSLDDPLLENGPEGKYWVSNLSAPDFSMQKSSMREGTRDYIELTLPEPEEGEDPEIAKLIISGSDTGLLGSSEANLFGLAGETLPHLYNLMDNTAIGKLAGEGIFRTAALKVQILDEKGSWVDYPEQSSNAFLGSYRTILVPLKRSLIRQNKLRLGMIAYSYMIDYAAVDCTKDEMVHVIRAKPEMGALSARALAESDDERVKIMGGELVGISFKDPAGHEGMERSYFLETEGYYHPGEREERSALDIEEIRNPLDALAAMGKIENWAIYARMMHDNSYAERYMLDYYLDSKRNIDTKYAPSKTAKTEEEKHNSLYTDFVRLTVSGCVVPIDGLKITSSTNLCAGGTYIVHDSDLDGKIIEISGSNIIFDCKRSVLDSGGSDFPQQNENAGVAIGFNFSQNSVIRNCNITKYGIGIGSNYSYNVEIYNNTLNMCYLGIGAERTNNSIIRNNTIANSHYVGIGLAGESKNNTIAGNTVINTSLLALALEGADNTTMEYNIVNGSADKNKLHLAAIGLTKGAYYNTIRNNTITNVFLGIGMVDVGKFMQGDSYGLSGQFNNFSSNIINNVMINGIGMLYPYDEDYYNYFDQNNIVRGERFYYYLNVHGNETDYVQITGLNLTAPNTTDFTGKLNFINCSYINITNSNLSDNFYGLFIIDSHHIIVSNVRSYKNNDMPVLPLISTGVVVGAGFVVINSQDINFTSNNASENFYGYYTRNSLNISFYNNTAQRNSWKGFYINRTNSSLFIKNTAFANDVAAYSFEYSWSNRIINNTARDSAEIGSSKDKGARGRGFNFLSTFNNTLTNNLAYNCSYGFIMQSSNETFANNTAINNTLAGVAFSACIGNFLINDTGNIVENNTGSGYAFTACNNTVVNGLNTTRNSKAGFEVYHSSYLTMSALWSKNNNYGYYFNESNNCTLANSYSINSTSHEVYFYSSTYSNIANSFIINNVSGNDVYSDTNSWNYLVNTSLNQSNFGNGTNSNASVQWYLDFYVTDNESIPVSDASIWLNDTFGNNYTGASDIYARARLNLTEYTVNDNGKVYYSNYTWNITKVGYMSNVSMVNMSQNREINVTINLFGGVSDISPPTSPIVYDGYDYVDYDWTNNATTLFASWSNSTDRHLIFYGYRILENGTCLVGSCAPTEVAQVTQTAISGLTLLEGYNYTIGIRARDTNYYYAPFAYSDGIIVDLTRPNVTANSTTHPNSSQWYSNPNVTFFFYGNDSLSGISGFSYVLDENSGTGPDLIEETREQTTLQSMKNTGDSRTFRANGTGSAFAVFSKISGNLSIGDAVSVRVALTEDTSDMLEEVAVKAYLLSKTTTITNYDMENLKASSIVTKYFDITHKSMINADSYSFDLVATANLSNSFYVVLASHTMDDNNTYNASMAGTGTDIDNTTESLICEEGASCTNTTLSFDYAIEVKKNETSAVRYKSYSNLANGEHWLHMRAKDVAGNWANPAHFKVMIDAVNGTPLYTIVKPVGYIATAEPTLAVNTNEYTTCYYNTTNTTYTEMTTYDNLYHEKKLSSLAEGTYTYSFNCTDRAGNTAYNDTTFIIDIDAVPDAVTIYPMSNYTVGKTITVNVNATKNYNNAPYGLGELADYFTFNLTNSTGTYKISAKVTDMGNGMYSVSFTAPVKAGDYTLTANVRGVSDTEDFTASSYTLAVKYASSDLDSPNTNTRITYSTIGTSYIIGLAGDSSSATTSGTSSSQLKIAGPAINDNLYIFITRPTAEPGDVAKYMDGASFVDLDNPSFGYLTTQDEHVLSTMLEYEDISIVGVDEVQTGRYTLLIKNDGLNQTNGKTRVSISII